MKAILVMVALVGCGKSNGSHPNVSEARFELHKLEVHAKAYFIERDELPAGKVALTPAAACCPTRCEPSATAFSDPVWVALDFHVDEPHRYQYSYESDGKTGFTATAVADLDCNGSKTTYTLVGKVEHGVIEAAITNPQ